MREGKNSLRVGAFKAPPPPHSSGSYRVNADMANMLNVCSSLNLKIYFFQEI